jgi:glycosyltransferase involved in cell wall biosynthesis
MKNILIIGYVWPEPRSSAAGTYVMQLIDCFLQQGLRVTFASPAQFSSTDKQGETRADLTSLGVAEKSIALNCSSFDDWVAELNPDAVFFDRYMMEEQFGWRVEQHCPQALRVLISQDLHSLRAARQQCLKDFLREHPEQTDIPPQDFSQIAARMTDSERAESELAVREISAIYRCDLSLMVSDVENDFLTRFFSVPSALLLHCPLFYDLADTQPAKTFSQRADFISIGNFLHAPNWDAVLWLQQSIWPLIRQQLPDAQLKIYGAYAPQKAHELHKPHQGFDVCGWAEDALAVMSDARVCLAPLRFGAGIKGKLLEAMLCGTPSVTTTIGAEAMQLLEGDAADNAIEKWGGGVADNAQAFANAAVQLYQSADAWQRAQAVGFAILQQRFAADTVAPLLINALQIHHAQLAQHRSANFTGRMLRHHLHKSTHYMARWIESKNQLAQSRLPP